MSKLEQLKKVTNKREFANLLGLKLNVLTHSLYVLRPENQYSQFKIPKKNGGKRTITAPTGKLKFIQQRLSAFLYDCLDEINKTQFPDSELANPTAKHGKILKVKCTNAGTKQPALSHGFERKRSIITNAMMHLNRKHVLNIDLKDFFGSFNFGRVRGFFIKNKHFELSPDIATVIAQIACLDNKLPQGSPCSPVITNLITHILDIRLAELAAKYSCVYSRYADDITFSTRQKLFPPQIMRQEGGKYTAGKKLRSEISRAGFTINHSKTRILYRDSRQDVTGLVVNRKPNTKKEYWRTARAQCHHLFKTGSFTKEENGRQVEGNINELEGQLNFIDQVDHYNRLRQGRPLNHNYHLKSDALKAQNKTKQRNHLYSGREKVFSQFLFYRLFYASDKPTLLTEGKTDNIYLKSAINQLAVKHPKLAKKKTTKNPYELLLRFVKYSQRTRFLLELEGGADYLKSFVEKYEHLYNRYTAPCPNYPVIIVVDNDSGPDKLFSYICSSKTAGIFLKGEQKNITKETHEVKKKSVKNADFIHLIHNLYLVTTPLKNDKDTDIESLFKDQDLLRKHQGRCFNTATKRDTKKDLSKDVFANHIVKSHKKEINFNGFKPLLNRFVKVIEHYEKLRVSHEVEKDKDD